MKYFGWSLLCAIIGFFIGLSIGAEYLAFVFAPIGFMAPMYFLVESIYKDVNEIKQYTKFTADKVYNDINE